MPSVDHCINKPSEMTTLTNSLEVFDTYKHREDKDSDEESFHLPLDDDESEPKYQETAKNGNDTEEEILNKFDSAAANFESIDSQLEERLLNDEDEQKKPKENGVNEPAVNSSESTPCDGEKSTLENGSNHCDVECKKAAGKNSSGNKKCSSESTNHVDAIDAAAVEASSTVSNGVAADATTEKDNSDDRTSDEATKDDAVKEKNQVPKVDVGKDSSALDKSDNDKKENLLSEIDDIMRSINEKDLNIDEKCKISKDDAKEGGSTDKCENSNDSSKNQNEDSEDLFDISIIRDAEEDNAESAYNEAHPEESHIDESEDYDERNDDKAEDDSNSDKANNLEEDEEEEDIDMDKHEDQLKHDDVDIEETNLKLDCDSMKDAISDGESDSGNRTDVQSNKQAQDANVNSSGAKQSARECRLDEVTGKMTNGESAQPNFLDNSESTREKTMDVDSEDAEKRKSLKRTICEEGESGIAKKSRTEQTTDVEIKEVEKPKEKLPLRTLLSLSDFMKSKKSNRRLTMHDLEEFCLQKICEVIVHKSDLGDVHHQLKLQEQLIETMRKEIQQLTKQARDLEIVNKKLMNDLKQQNATQKPLNPLKITRSVGLQVKFTPAFEANMKRRQPAAPTQKVPVQQTTGRGPRNIPNAAAPGPNRQVTSPQKQAQPLPKPNTPLLSQALQQNRRAVANEVVNKNVPQAIRPKGTDPKAPSVIDLTDEDDKKDKNNKNMAPKIVAQKNIAVPLRTAPVRVNATQGIRLTTSQGKVSPITSVVTSSSPQVMYVVQQSPQNVLASSLGPKAVVVNFQSANGVLTSALNGSAVSVIPKQSNTIQLKAVAKAVPSNSSNNKSVKAPSKHPAPLPPPPVVRVGLDKQLKPIPPKPHLTIRKTETGIILQWKMPYELEMYEVIASYQLYAYQETSASPSTEMWRKVGDVKALALPMACTLTQFADKNKYYFAVRPVDIHKRIGVFSDPEEISL